MMVTNVSEGIDLVVLNRVKISPQNCCLLVSSPYLEFTRCCSSEYVFSHILLNCLLVKVFGQKLYILR